MEVGIIVVVYNLSSEIFLLQMAAIRKFCKDDFTIEIIDNSSDLEKAKDIKYHANQLGLNYVKTFANSENGSDSHTWAANLAYQKFKDIYPFVFFIDHDCIPVVDFSVKDILSGGHVIAGLGQGQKKKYMWAGLVMIANERIDREVVDFSTNAQYGLDTGGNLYLIVDKYGESSCIFFNEAYHQNPYFNSHRYSYYAGLNNDMFYHCVNGSNWNNTDRQTERVNAFINVVKNKTGL